MSSRSIAWLLTTTLLVGALSDAAQADDRRSRREAGQEESRDSRRAKGGLSLDQAVEMVQKRFRARVVRAESRQEDGRTVYHLRLLSEEGRVWTVKVDADSGAIR